MLHACRLPGVGLETPRRSFAKSSHKYWAENRIRTLSFIPAGRSGRGNCNLDQHTMTHQGSMAPLLLVGLCCVAGLHIVSIMSGNLYF